MLKLLQLFGAFLCVLLSGANWAQSISKINAFVEVVDAKGQPRPAVIDEVTVRFPLIAGSIFGSPQSGDILVERARVGSSLSLDVERMRSAGARFASPAEPHVVSAGLVVEPRNARFARFGTFVTEALSSKAIGYGSFIDSKSRTALALVYFDEPCRISGVMRAGRLEAKHSISIRTAGLHWVRIKEVASSTFELDNADEFQEVTIGVEPIPLAKPGSST